MRGFFIFRGEEEADLIIRIQDKGGVTLNKPYPFDKHHLHSLLYISTGLAQTDLKKDEVNSSDLLMVKEPNSTYKTEEKGVRYYPITPKNMDKIWDYFYRQVREYQSQEASFRISLTRRIERENSSLDIAKELEKWSREHPNPLETIAQDCLDVILNKFQLAVETEIDDIKQINALQIRSLSDNTIVPYEKLSTGTKQIIFTAFPIYQLLQDDSIVLMDEPETSLYPDIQREIIPFYTSFDKEKKSQFFFATHSPIIASAFEPWEIVELKFDAKGKVYREKYYEGENHVDNYKIDPRYLRWDDILTKVFDMPVDSNAEYRSQKLMEYAILKSKIKALKDKNGLENPSPETKEMVAEFEKAYDLLTGNWAVTQHEKN